MLTQRQIKSITKRIEKHRDAVGRDRDALEAAIRELTWLRDCCDEAWNNLQRARAGVAELNLAAWDTENASLREALEWYREQARLARLIHSEGDPGRRALSDDGGKRARVELNKEPQS